MTCQYGEEMLILSHTRGKRGGFVVDVGAADPVVNSNSEFLIREYGWSAILIDPLPEHFDALCRHHVGNGGVQVVQLAVNQYAGPLWLYPGEQGTTAKREWRDRLATYHGTKYGESIRVQARPLTDILDDLNAPRVIDFLSVDCEGMDMDVLRSLDWSKYRVDLCCVEARPTWTSLVEFMAERGLNVIGSTNGNTLFGRPS